MRPHVDLEVLAACELLVAFGAHEGSLAGVDAEVVDQFILGLQELPHSFADSP